MLPKIWVKANHWTMPSVCLHELFRFFFPQERFPWCLLCDQILELTCHRSCLQRYDFLVSTIHIAVSHICHPYYYVSFPVVLFFLCWQGYICLHLCASQRSFQHSLFFTPCTVSATLFHWVWSLEINMHI